MSIINDNHKYFHSLDVPILFPEFSLKWLPWMHGGLVIDAIMTGLAVNPLPLISDSALNIYLPYNWTVIMV
jgi:hypothetical protein